MGNLRGYQTMTTMAKKAGGPKELLGVTLVAGYGLIRTTEALVRKAVRVIKERNVPCETKNQVFGVTSDGDHNDMKVRAGDSYRVLECDGDAILIEVLGDSRSPYFVSSTFLRAVSDYPQDDADGSGE